METMSDPISEDYSEFGVFFVAGFAEQRLDKGQPAPSPAGPAGYRRQDPVGPPLHLVAIPSETVASRRRHQPQASAALEVRTYCLAPLVGKRC
jgi:hypothetical protein